jgi:hypothetical protein
MRITVETTAAPASRPRPVAMSIKPHPTRDGEPFVMGL